MSSSAPSPKPSDIPVRKSYIRKSVTRKYNTAKYETMDITVDHEHEIEWSSIEELMKKSNNLTSIVVKDFLQTEEAIFKQIGIKSYAAITDVVDLPTKKLSPEEKKDLDKLD